MNRKLHSHDSCVNFCHNPKTILYEKDVRVQRSTDMTATSQRWSVLRYQVERTLTFSVSMTFNLAAK